MDRYRRSPDRGRYARDPPPTDSYVPAGNRAIRPRSRSPGGPRRRSRTPPRAQSDTWRAPAPRRYERDGFPPREARPLSPRRDYRPAESHYDDRANKRGREMSPNGRDARSPPPAKRERLASPPREYPPSRGPRAYSPPRERAGYRARSRSPIRRDERVDPYAAKDWRRRSPSPRSVRPPAELSGRNSGTTSRRSSPRGFARRPYPVDDARPPPTSSYQSPRARSPGYRRPSPPRHARSPFPNSTSASESHAAQSAPTADYYERAPPTGPASYAASPANAPAAVSMSAHNRPGGVAIPSAPRGSYGSYRGRGGGPPRGDYGRDGSGPPPRRGSYGGTSSFGRGGPPRDAYPPRDPYYPRDGFESRGRDHGPPGPGHRGSSNSTSTTYPRTQVFNKPNSTAAHLADLPSIKNGGEKLAPLYDTARAEKLEEEAARLRKAIDEKQAKKRQGLREWDKADRESKTAGLRTELADEALRGLNGEDDIMGSAF